MRKYSSNLAFVDLLFNLLVGFTSLFIISFLMINPIAKQGEVTPPVMMMVQSHWDDNSAHDVDLWVRTPMGTVGYSSNDKGAAKLERDDLGKVSDTYVVNGETQLVRRNYEVVNFTAMPDGEYIINVHMFSAQLTKPETVRITITVLGPFKEIWSGDIILDTPKRELTAISFIVEDGVITDLNTDIQVKVRTSTTSRIP
jgi:hypothetical protein